jgi:phosphatidylethanolamine-binding protein (PEBP) family uncharacterized protein
MRIRGILTIGLISGTFALVGCGSDDTAPASGNSAGHSGSGGSSGTGGSSTGGSTGTGGDTSGSGGAETGGSTGTGGGNPDDSGTGTGGGTTDDASADDASSGSGGAGPDSGGGTGGGGTGGAPEAGTNDCAGKPFTLTSTGFDKQSDGLHFVTTAQHVGDQSPPFAWTCAPAGTKAFVFTMFDSGQSDVTDEAGLWDLVDGGHWILWNIQPTVSSLPQNLEHKSPVTKPAELVGALQTNLANQPGYFGPGADLRVYVFDVWAMPDTTYNGPTTGSKPNIANAIKALHNNKAVLGHAQLWAYGHKN